MCIIATVKHEFRHENRLLEESMNNIVFLFLFSFLFKIIITANVIDLPILSIKITGYAYINPHSAEFMRPS